MQRASGDGKSTLLDRQGVFLDTHSRGLRRETVVALAVGLEHCY